MNLGKNIKSLRKDKKYSQLELASILGVSQTSVAHYEAGTRQPTIDTLKQLSQLFNITIDSLVGHSIKEESKVVILSEKKLVDSLVTYLTEKNEKSFMEVIDSSVYSTYAMNTMIDDVLAKVMFKIGVMWEQGLITEVDEHYATNIVRKVVNFSSLKNIDLLKNRKAISFSIAAEKHTLGLEMVNTYLESEGVETLYLGTNVQIKSIEKILAEFEPEFIFISITMSDNMNSLIHFVDYINGKYKGKYTIGIGGQGYVIDNSIEEMDNVMILKSIKDLDVFLNPTKEVS